MRNIIFLPGLLQELYEAKAKVLPRFLV